MRVCDNCKKRDDHNIPESQVKRVTIGGQKGGSQRDPEYKSIDLCAKCEKLLETGALGEFKDRFSQ